MLYNKIQNRDIKIIYSQCYERFNLKTSKSKYLIANVNTSVMHLVDRIIFSLVRFNHFKSYGPSVGQQMHSGHDDTCFHFHIFPSHRLGRRHLFISNSSIIKGTIFNLIQI